MRILGLYKGPKSSVLLPSDFDAEAEEEEKLEGDSAGESDENTTGEEDTTEESSSDDEDKENEKYSTTYSFQSARRNFTKSFGGSRTDVKSAVRGYVKALGGSKQATRQDRKARQVTGGIYYLFSGTPSDVRRKLEDAGISVEKRPVRDVLSDVILYLAPPADNLEDSLVTNSLSEAMSELAEVIDISEDAIEAINPKLMETLLSQFVKCYIFNKIIRDMTYGAFSKSDSTKAVKDGETRIKEYVDAIVDAVLPTYFIEGVKQEEINKVIGDMYEACYQEAEKM